MQVPPRVISVRGAKATDTGLPPVEPHTTGGVETPSLVDYQVEEDPAVEEEEQGGRELAAARARHIIQRRTRNKLRERMRIRM